MRFDGVKGLPAQVVLDPAGVGGRGLLVDAEPDEELCQHGVTLVDILRFRFSASVSLI